MGLYPHYISHENFVDIQTQFGKQTISFFNNRVLRENQMFSTTKVSGGPAFSPPMQNKGWGGQGPAAQLKQEEAGLCGLKNLSRILNSGKIISFSINTLKKIYFWKSII